ncbi:MAG: hypothetical protein OXM55_02220 [Bdellovibrionales bacterium]|nr:hypothetical protein [Bdellovibrionales bacterium]
MKIIISLAVFALALVACQSDKQKCEKEGKVWKAETETCISTEQAECEEKENMAWNEEKNTCEEKSDAQVECEAKENMTWNKEENKCEEKSKEIASCAEQEGKEWINDQCVDKTYFTILFKSKGGQQHNLQVTNESNQQSLDSTGQCVKVATSQFKDLTVSILLKDHKVIKVLCDNDDTTVGSPPCSAGNYEVWYNHRPSGPPNTPAIGYTLTKKEEAATDCEVIDTIK